MIELTIKPTILNTRIWIQCEATWCGFCSLFSSHCQRMESEFCSLQRQNAGSRDVFFSKPPEMSEVCRQTWSSAVNTHKLQLIQITHPHFYTCTSSVKLLFSTSSAQFKGRSPVPVVFLKHNAYKILHF